MESPIHQCSPLDPQTDDDDDDGDDDDDDDDGEEEDLRHKVTTDNSRSVEKSNFAFEHQIF